MRRTKKEIMEGVESVKSRIIDHNTVEYYKEDGTKVIRLHLTDIITYNTDGSVTLNTGGWKTVTTKDRINKFSPFYITQHNWIWYFNIGEKEYQFKDGITIFPDGKVAGERDKKDIKLFNEHKKWIDRYCKKLKGLKKLPYPSNGDCWYCLFKNEDGKTMGDLSNDNDHLISHLKEQYIHGSLILNALEWAGYINAGIIFQMDVRDSIVNSVRRYFKFKLGYPY